MDSKIEIPLSKKKGFFNFTLTVIFIILGWMFLFNPDFFTSTRFRNREIIRIIGAITLLFFGFCAFVIIRKLLDQKMGLIIDEKGITDNTNASSVGLIEWKDITDIRTIQVASTKFLVVGTNDPHKYINKAKNIIARKSMQGNYKMYGSPLSIISNSIQIKFNDLQELIISEFEKRKHNK